MASHLYVRIILPLHAKPACRRSGLERVEPPPREKQDLAILRIFGWIFFCLWLVNSSLDTCFMFDVNMEALLFALVLWTWLFVKPSINCVKIFLGACPLVPGQCSYNIIAKSRVLEVD